MQAMQETSKWNDGFDINHIYLLDGDKALAYIKKGTTDPFYFKSPMTIDKRRRTFVEVKPSPFKMETPSSVVVVTGSKGQTYEVDTVLRTCTCPSSKYHRGECKHIKSVCK